MRRWPAAQIIMSLSPDSSMSTQIDSPAKAEVEPLSIATAPPARSSVLLIREARVLVVKLPVSSISDGHFLIRMSAKLVVDFARSCRPAHARLAKQLAEDVLHLGQTQPHFQLVGEIAAEFGSDHHAAAFAIERLLVVAGVGQGLLGRFQKHELQRIGFGDLLGRHFVLAPVVLEVVDETADERLAARLRPRRSASSAVRPAAVLGSCSRRERFPEFGEPLGTGKDAAHADDGDRLVVRRGRRAVAATCVPGLAWPFWPAWPTPFRRSAVSSVRRRVAAGQQLAVIGFVELVEHDVHVQAADAEGIDRRPAGLAIGRSGPGLRRPAGCSRGPISNRSSD